MKTIRRKSQPAKTMVRKISLLRSSLQSFNNEKSYVLLLSFYAEAPQLPKLALGASGYSPIFSRPFTPSTIPYAVSKGITVIDTAPWYQTSETVVGEELGGLERGSYRIHTKTGEKIVSFRMVEMRSIRL